MKTRCPRVEDKFQTVEEMLVHKIASHPGNWTDPMSRGPSLILSACLDQARVQVPNLRPAILIDLFRAFERGVKSARRSAPTPHQVPIAGL